jgi:hypothetical protein
VWVVLAKAAEEKRRQTRMIIAKTAKMAIVILVLLYSPAVRGANIEASLYLLWLAAGVRTNALKEKAHIKYAKPITIKPKDVPISLKVSLLGLTIRTSYALFSLRSAHPVAKMTMGVKGIAAMVIALPSA